VKVGNTIYVAGTVGVDMATGELASPLVSQSRGEPFHVLALQVSVRMVAVAELLGQVAGQVVLDVAAVTPCRA
jgi:hypothetical protein